MAWLGISLIVASFVLVCLRPPAWLPVFLRNLQHGRLGPAPRPPLIKKSAKDKERNVVTGGEIRQGEMPPPPSPPPLLLPVIQQDHGQGKLRRLDSACDDETTPKASAAVPPDDLVPLFTLSGPAEPSSNVAVAVAAVAKTASTVPAVAAAAASNTSTLAANRLISAPPTAAAAAPGLMAPPPRPAAPPGLMAPPPRPTSSLSPAPARNNHLHPAPNRGLAPPLSSSSSLAPPPTHSAKPKKPSKTVVLEPGHSPLDWARLSGHPSSDLRGLPPNSPYLRVTPSMLKKQKGRKGTDAWMVLGGKVYNVSPYVPFHPGGGPELLRGAGKDGTKLFGEVHPWVNYEGMLSACLVGIWVPVEEDNDMEAMD
ncbi:hypothetical protein B0H63DRAFT_82882 [Podospora didyma]|uniref:Cytochrome b5 heme-binding domain-containing protein n=1 Tax=Podospora didyma TaxID=330526 RepID=A0AAE0K0V9_9PEZI|nr:hypothetical protein B0H63DRAFT_82882 [Podospora didyma]